jgi:SAM-dependent methyltransferase
MDSTIVADSSGCGTSLSTDPLHPVAARGFAANVDAYRKSRPSYPPDAMAWLAEALGLSAGRVVVDVGAGTGKFTALLVPTGATVIAIEPLESMRAGLAQELPFVSVLEGQAEALPLADASADAIVAAQAFHWFDMPRALAEFARVLRPRGRLGVIWNDIDTSVDWVAEFNAIISPPRRVTPLPSDAGLPEFPPLFGERHDATFPNAHMHDRASMLARVESMSFVAVLPEAEQAEIFERVRVLMDTHPELVGHEQFELPYVTHAYWIEKV